ncbi:hypothetical protein J6590_087277 [Homalodisca vitripennis]|nr:hypothetical protein J6590_087277 [Homalodisca vitripennis]
MFRREAKGSNRHVHATENTHCDFHDCVCRQGTDNECKEVCGCDARLPLVVLVTHLDSV